MMLRGAIAVAVVVGLTLSVGLAERVPPAWATTETAPGSFRWLHVSRPGAVDSLRVAVGADRFAQILRLNRLDPDHVRRADTLVIPGLPGATEERVFPDSVSAAGQIPKLVIVSLRVQAFGTYAFGRLVHAGPISSGGRTAPTPPGLYHVNWRSRRHVSTHDSSWIMRWTVNFENHQGYAFHQYALPGQPASHRCIRLLEADARWLFAWVDPWRLSPDGRATIAPGTPIAIVGTYDFASPRPWRALPADPEATRLRANEEAAVISLLTGSGPAARALRPRASPRRRRSRRCGPARAHSA